MNEIIQKALKKKRESTVRSFVKLGSMKNVGK